MIFKTWRRQNGSKGPYRSTPYRQIRENYRNGCMLLNNVLTILVNHITIQRITYLIVNNHDRYNEPFYCIKKNQINEHVNTLKITKLVHNFYIRFCKKLNKTNELPIKTENFIQKISRNIDRKTLLTYRYSFSIHIYIFLFLRSNYLTISEIFTSYILVAKEN
jgi:hypothetical protein